MHNFWSGVILGWIAGELGLCAVLALVSDRADRAERKRAVRGLPLDYDGEPDDA